MRTNPKAQGPGCSRDVEEGGGCEGLDNALKLRTVNLSEQATHLDGSCCKTG